jgi:hypothetical protein
MTFLIFVGALLAIVVFAVIVNRLTGTKAAYLDTLQFEPGEKEIWRDAEADFATVPRVGRSAVMSFVRIRRHTAVWTDRRIIVAQQTLGSPKHMITHQIYFVPEAGASGELAGEAAGEAFGGFYGRGFITIAAVKNSFSQVNGKDCVRIAPAADCGARLNLDEALIFTDRLQELEQRLHAAGQVRNS